MENVALLNEPQAAAIDFASVAHVEPGQLVLVYDLGGGTFDLALLRREDDGGFTLVGEAAGAERLGGIDFDEAVLQHVLSHVPPDVVDRVRAEPTGRLALAQLRSRCVEAKEALSGDVAVDVPVVLPGFSSTVRVTRNEFDAMIRPMVLQTVDLARRVLDRSGVAPEDLSAALLIGGSSRIPLVSELVGAELGAPVRVDAHPKLVVARGAARWAASLPLNASPGSGSRARSAHRQHDPDRRAGRRKLALAIGTAVVVVAVLVTGITWVVSSSGGSNGDAQSGVTSTAGPTSSAQPGGTTADSVAGGDVSLPAIPAGVAQRVTYTIDPAAVWDDGTPITVARLRVHPPGEPEHPRHTNRSALRPRRRRDGRRVRPPGGRRPRHGVRAVPPPVRRPAAGRCVRRLQRRLGRDELRHPLLGWGVRVGVVGRGRRPAGAQRALLRTGGVVRDGAGDVDADVRRRGGGAALGRRRLRLPELVRQHARRRVGTHRGRCEHRGRLRRGPGTAVVPGRSGPARRPDLPAGLCDVRRSSGDLRPVLRSVLGGSPALCGPVVPGPYCADAFAASFDPEGATALLTDGGWTKDTSGLWTNAAGEVPQVRFVIAAGNTRRHGIQDFMIADMRGRGFDVVADNFPRGADCDARLRQLDYDMTIRYAKAPPDPSHLTPTYSCSEVPTSANGFAGANWSGWCNEQASAALHAADETVDDAARTTLVQQAVAAMAEDAALLPLYQFPRLGAYRTDRIGGDIAADLGNYDAFANFATWEDVDGDGVLRIGAEQVPSCLSPVTCPSDWQRWLVQTSVFPRVLAPQADGTFAMTPLVADVTVQIQDG